MVVDCSGDGDVAAAAGAPFEMGRLADGLTQPVTTMMRFGGVDMAAFNAYVAGDVRLLAGSGERGRRNGPALQATFSFPNDIAASPDGRHLYVNEIASDTGDHTRLAPMVVRRIVLRP